MSEGLNMSPEELEQLTDCTLPAVQLKHLHAHGFWLAWRNLKSGRVVLPRAHFLAVCAGARPAADPATPETMPAVLPPPPSKRRQRQATSLPQTR
jgi:hypothetical protein